MKPEIRVKKHLGVTEEMCCGLKKCPAILELEDGDFAIIGEDITQAASNALPASAGCASSECIVRLPRSVVLAAKSELASIAGS
jgi:hypothetical protein